MQTIIITKHTDARALAGRTFTSPIGAETFIESAAHSPNGDWISALVQVRNTGRPGRPVERTAYAIEYGVALVEI